MARNRMVPAMRSLEDCEVVAVSSRSAARAVEFAKANHVPNAYGSLEELLANDAVEAVYVGSSNELHCEQVIAAARAGKHVLCEKPLAMTLDQAFAMHGACELAGVVFGTNHYHRLKPSHTAIRNLIQDGVIGDPLLAQVTFGIQLAPEQRTWRLDSEELGGGVIRDLTVHEADIARSLFTSEVVEVLAVADRRGERKAGLDDSVAGVLRMRSGALVSFLDSFVVPNPVHDISVLGTTGSIIAQGVMRSDSDGTVTLRREGSDEVVGLPPWENPFRISITAFNRAVRGSGEPAVSGVDGIKSLAVALAVLNSSQTGHLSAVVDVDLVLSNLTPRMPRRGTHQGVH